MIGERRIKTEVAKDLLIEGAKVNGSWKKDPEHCLETIRDGLRKGEQEWIEWDAGKRAGCVV